ncbi:class I SAM-dependent methyltransferase [Radiobacillus deserti]|uniref:Class I SAM-dependent methyltransferase n=1 Tax=Radiobacillus deserti TaxID=2594883 RepID=A0A516KCV8_9BACI|nr:class I SAM-dependent methyltransferase [Radiobacillus deserti]QDP39176.1 class I SAM-dependent methyltransferase [Radiobacillus deserti]
MNDIFKHLQTPEVFKEGNVNYWTDSMFSDLILRAHLDQNHSGGSRNHEFMTRSVSFINDVAPSDRYNKLIDLGCGPGLYCEKLSEIGYDVTGVDISESSIEYAQNKAKQENLNITYKIESFLDLNESDKYDVALLIYYLYGSINSNGRKKLLERIFKSLKNGGILLLDVTSKVSFDNFKEEQTWSFSSKQGTLANNSYIGFRQALKYPDQITLEKTSLLFKDKDPITFNIWNKSFDKDELIKEAKDVGFNIKNLYSDVAGQELKEESEEIAILLEK